MRWAIERAIRILNPACAKLPQAPKTPSSSMLQRYELSLDVAFMMQRADVRGEFRRFMLADSSPQKELENLFENIKSN